MINLKKERKLRSLICVLLLFSNIFGVYSQGSIGLHGTINEYSGDLNGDSYHFYNFSFPNLGGAISLQQFLTPSFNIVEKFSFDQVQYQSNDKQFGVDADFYNLNLHLKYKFNNDLIFKENAVVAPFITVGIGGSYVESDQYTETDNSTITSGEFAANATAGLGILFQFNDRLGFEIANTLNMPLYDAWDGISEGDNDVYLQHSAGLVFKLRKPTDTDADGISDRKDSCPDTPTEASVDSKGCPIDTDEDTVPDYLDKCVDVYGLAKL